MAERSQTVLNDLRRIQRLLDLEEAGILSVDEVTCFHRVLEFHDAVGGIGAPIADYAIDSQAPHRVRYEELTERERTDLDAILSHHRQDV